MPAGRPKKYAKSRTICIYLDDKDLSYLDDHRGKVTRGDYLKEGMYALKSEHSKELISTTEKLKQLSAEVYELKKQLMFEQSKHKKKEPVKEVETTTHIKMNKTALFEKALINIGKSYNRDRFIDAAPLRLYSEALNIPRETLKECIVVFVDEYQMNAVKINELKIRAKLDGAPCPL